MIEIFVILNWTDTIGFSDLGLIFENGKPKIFATFEEADEYAEEECQNYRIVPLEKSLESLFETWFSMGMAHDFFGNEKVIDDFREGECANCDERC